MIRKPLYIAAVLVLSFPAAAQNCYPSWVCESQGPSVSDTLNQQWKDQRRSEERWQRQQEFDRIESQNRRLRAREAQRRERQWRDPGTGIYIPHRRR